jgi:uncharacterized protein YndB with AHSA1/START domain
MMNEPTAAATIADFELSRVFDAPRNLLWQCFTDPERMKQWWAPKGFTVIASTMDLRVGGTYHYGLRAPNGQPMWGKFTYREIVPKRRLVFILHFSDEKGGVTRHPGSDKWPLYMFSTFTFEDAPDGKTRFTVTWRPHEATAEELAAFDAAHSSMTQGWGGTMDQLETYLAQRN